MDKISMFGISIDVMNMVGAVSTIHKWINSPDYSCRYVVTPNVQHVVMLDKRTDFRKAYQSASLVVADGRPIVSVAKLFGMPLPGTVPGSDLVPAIFDASKDRKTPLRVFLLGGLPGVAERASLNISSKWENVQVVGVYSPSFGFENDPEECKRICDLVSIAKPDLLVIGLGAPKQENWVYAYSHMLNTKVALCVGATIDFLAGEKPRAPGWMRTYGLEWAHRIASEPRRLSKRYANDAIYFPWLILKEWLRKSSLIPQVSSGTLPTPSSLTYDRISAIPNIERQLNRESSLLPVKDGNVLSGIRIDHDGIDRFDDNKSDKVELV